MVPGITNILKKRHEIVFDEFIRNERTDRYNLMCSISAHEKQKPPSFYYGISSCGNALPVKSTTEVLLSLSATTNFIDCWLQGL